MLNANNRNTKQKEVILGVLEKGGTHLDAIQIYNKAVSIMPRLSLATVYRHLRILKEQGVVEPSLFGEDHAHYELVASASKHQHLKCVSCEKVVEFDLSIEELLPKIKKAQGYRIDSARLYIEGLCPACQNKK